MLPPITKLCSQTSTAAARLWSSLGRGGGPGAGGGGVGVRPRRLDFQAVVALAAAHRWEAEHRCGRRVESCLPCGLGAMRMGGCGLTWLNRRAALHLAFAHRSALLHDSQARDCCTRCALDGLGSHDPAARTSLTALLDLWEQLSPALHPSPTATTPTTP